MHLGAELRALGLTAIPVVRPSDSAATRRDLLESTLFESTARCVRIGVDDLDQGAPIAQVLQDLVNDTGAEVRESHLVIDLGEVPSETVFGVYRQFGGMMLSGLGNAEEWATVTVAAGAFPASLTTVSPDEVGRIPRLDWLLWQAIVERAPGRRPGFGDYGIAHPAVPQGAAFAPDRKSVV